MRSPLLPPFLGAGGGGWGEGYFRRAYFPTTGFSRHIFYFQNGDSYEAVVCVFSPPLSSFLFVENSSKIS